MNWPSQNLKSFFVPWPENDYYPYSLRRQFVSFYVIAALILKLLSFYTAWVLPGNNFFAAILSDSIVSLTNQERAANGLGTLVENPILDKAAADKASDMFANNYFAHFSPVGVSPWYWFQKENYDYHYAGENLAMDFFDSSDVVNAWMNSPLHRANILNDNYRDIGVAVVSGELDGHPTTLVVQLFGATFPSASSGQVPPAIQVAEGNNLVSKTTMHPPSPKPIRQAQGKSSPVIVSPLALSQSNGLQNSTTVVAGANVESNDFVPQKSQKFPPTKKAIVSTLGLISNPRWLYFGLIFYVAIIAILGIAFDPRPRPRGLAAFIKSDQGQQAGHVFSALLIISALILVPFGHFALGWNFQIQ